MRASVVNQHQPKGIEFPKNPKGGSFQASWYSLYPWQHYDEELDADFVTHVSWRIRTKYQYDLGRTMFLLQKGPKIGKKALYSEKDKPGAFEKHQHSQSH